MPSPRHRGTIYEQQAATFLQRRGFVIVTQNWHCTGGEIDLVTTLNHTWVFVEVRYRRTGRLSAIESVNRRKINRLIHAAQHYLMTHQLNDVDWRIDVVAIDSHSIQHIPNAVELS